MPASVRSRALDRLAKLSNAADVGRLCQAGPIPRSTFDGSANGHAGSTGTTGRVPMSCRELDILLALCKTAHRVSDASTAQTLLKQLSPYLVESCYQAFKSSPFLQEIGSSPWEVMTASLTDALLTLGLHHPSVRHDVSETISSYIAYCKRLVVELLQNPEGISTIEQQAKGREFQAVATLTTSILGFLDAASNHIHFWSTSERLGLIDSLQSVLQDQLLIATETAVSAIRSSRHPDPTARAWRHHVRQYALLGRPLSAMSLRAAFMKLVESCATLLIKPYPDHKDQDVLQFLTLADTIVIPSDTYLVEKIAMVTTQELSGLDEGSDYVQIGSAWQQRLANSVKSRCLTSFLCCSIANESVADPEALLASLEATLADPSQIADEQLACTALRCQSALAKQSTAIASTLSRSIPRFLTTRTMPATVAKAAAESLLSILQRLPQDNAITTLYGLGNSLSMEHATDVPAGGLALFGDTRHSRNDLSKVHTREESNGSTSDTLSSTISDAVVTAIVVIAKGLADEKIVALALSMLVQKVGKTNASVDLKIISETAFLAKNGAPADFKSLLRLYDRITREGVTTADHALLRAVEQARTYLSRTIKGRDSLYTVYLQHLLEQVISKGETRPKQTPDATEIELAAGEMATLLRPLATLVASNIDTPGIEEIESFPILQRDAWYNIVVHGFGRRTAIAGKHFNELKMLARYAHSLIDEERAETIESDIELNIVLRRGKSAQSESERKKRLLAVLPNNESDLRSLDYPELVFLEAMHLIETLRAESGDITQVGYYFVDPFLVDKGLPIGKGHALGRCMEAVALATMDTYLGQTLSGVKQEFSTPYLAEQLSSILATCCHPIERVQTVAYRCASRIIAAVPSVLCQRASLFALLDLLTLMWSSCLEADTNEYDWRDKITVYPGVTSVHLSDDYDARNATLTQLYHHARNWIAVAVETAPLDVKGLLQTYLSDYSDDEGFGHLSMGRSMALEMGSVIPQADQRLQAVATQPNLNTNSASDFLAQYTTRQEYRFTDPLRYDEDTSSKSIASGELTSPQASTKSKLAAITVRLQYIESCFAKHEAVSLNELREALRKAASLLCRSRDDQSAIIRLFVGLPFFNFTKQTIKLGLSMWMGVIKENPRMESRILVEIVENWISTVHRKLGLFSDKVAHIDPFYQKEEFAPSDLEGINRQQQHSHDLIAPHYRILQFLSSHYNAARLGSQLVERTYLRLLITTLEGLRYTAGHPLAREIHFHIILLAQRVLDTSTVLEESAKWRLKDALLAAGLAWFRHPPRWSFGGNKLQVKAETKVMTDVANAIEASPVGAGQAVAAWRHLHSKQKLLLALIENECFRLSVWLSPLEHSSILQKLGALQRAKDHPESLMASMVSVAWQENPGIAIQLASRFKLGQVASEVRTLLLRQPEKALDEPDALGILLGPALPKDVSSQLKYLLYWAPVNPITAVTYFFPAYGFHPSIIQYAVRAFESHSVDITFFYVPQIVQALRYDELGYVERYIIETGKLSQLFAHQIIWNIKANAYKDEDSTDPDPMKPTLDKVMNRLISSFSGEDKAFYEREFTFFDQVTGISGKLKPFIKKSKPEKKQKIEEELRQIQVDPGVYLPCNPDGVVVGIDRKSGKPLQSHAKAPYMATFRVRRDVISDEDTIDEVGSQVLQEQKEKKTYEVWQSAIFKVGDDCRQDVLALQMISAFRGIFHSVGLPVYVFPNRVTATAPGCGVIDVLPNSVSRDMLGREAVNGLKEWFESRFGNRDAPAFQKARANFVKSLAAYSIISYLLQFKDRHNGNIMYDDQGHILHIDFGFCFDIVPGGVRFERAPFKLTKEMVAVMGGTDTQSFRWFEELCVKAFLVSRQHMEALAHIVMCMLDSGLPCFKPETMDHFRSRFVQHKTDREAAQYVRKMISDSFANVSTWVYDEFQLKTNGIPF